MLIYWLMFAVPVWATLFPARLKRQQAWAPWALVYVLFTLLIGLRHEVGGDWFPYLDHFEHTTQLLLADVLLGGDPGYYLINWLVAQLNGSIYHVNLICAAMLMYGVVLFCRQQPRPWVALSTAIPYLLVVVGMGYTRQSVAIGLILIGLIALGRGQATRALLWFALAATFHRSAVFMLPLLFLASSRKSFLHIALVALTTYLLYLFLLTEAGEALWISYVEAGMQSEGGFIRVLMNALAAVLMVWFRHHLTQYEVERRLFLWMAVVSIASVPLVDLASTAVDRVALYFMPLQFFVFSRVPRLSRDRVVRALLTVVVLVYYGAVLYVWLTFAANAPYWIPYQMRFWD